MAQGMPGLVEVTNTMFFTDKQYIPVDRWKDVTYGIVVVDYRPDIGVAVELSVLWFPHEFSVYHQLASVLVEYCAEHFERKMSLFQSSWRQLPWRRVEVRQHCFLCV